MESNTFIYENFLSLFTVALPGYVNHEHQKDTVNTRMKLVLFSEIVRKFRFMRIDDVFNATNKFLFSIWSVMLSVTETHEAQKNFLRAWFEN